MTDKLGKTAMVLYCDGSCRPNPGYGGYGIFGYHFKYVTKPKNIKHPLKANVFFNHDGISSTKTTEPIEVLGIIEVVYAISTPKTSNNFAELRAVIEALRLGSVQEGLTELTVITDSNYTVSSFNNSIDDWATKSNWRRQDGNPVAHQQEWFAILEYRNLLRKNGVSVKLQWVKGHNGDYGNEASDLYSVIGSNAARLQLEEGSTPFVGEIYSSYQTYQEYKKSYQGKDFIYHFKDLFFSSQPVPDTNYCFISSTEDDASKGRRATDSIFLSVKGYVPDLINRLKSFYRGIPRNYTCTCCIKLSGLENRDILRMGDYVDVRYLVRKKYPNKNTYSFIKSDSTFLEENVMDFPFITNINKLSYAMEVMDPPYSNTIVEDITHYLVKDGKLLISNKDRYIDMTSMTEGKIQFTQKLLIGVGYDLPNYLALKRLEEGLVRAELILHKDNESNFYTAFVKLTTDTREIYSVNFPNKFLALRTLKP